jgi:hypothetical protein
MIALNVTTYGGDAFTSILRWAILGLVILAAVVFLHAMYRVKWPKRRPWWRAEKTVAETRRQEYSRRHP